jgi:hypothetical protein
LKASSCRAGATKTITRARRQLIAFGALPGKVEPINQRARRSGTRAERACFFFAARLSF